MSYRIVYNSGGDIKVDEYRLGEGCIYFINSSGKEVFVPLYNIAYIEEL